MKRSIHHKTLGLILLLFKSFLIPTSTQAAFLKQLHNSKAPLFIKAQNSKSLREDFFGKTGRSRKLSFANRGQEFQESKSNSFYNFSPREITRQAFLENVRDKWENKSNFDKIPSKEKAISSALVKLNSIIVPRVSFNEVPLSQVLNSLALLSEEYDTSTKNEAEKGINFLLLEIDPMPKVTLTVKNLSLKRLLDLLVTTTSCTYFVENEIVTFYPSEHKGPALETKFFPISQAAITQLTGIERDRDLKKEESLIQNFLQRVGIDFTALGSHLAFDGTHLIITHTHLALQRCANLLIHYAEIPQIEIETKFLEIQAGKLQEMGNRYRFGNKNHHFKTGDAENDSLRSLVQAFSPTNNTLIENIIQTGNVSEHVPNNIPSLPGGINLGLASTPVGVLMGSQVQTLVRALEQEQDSDLMSAPKVTVLSGKTAEIVIAQEFLYPKEYGSPNSSTSPEGRGNHTGAAGVTITPGRPMNFEKRNIGVEMKVTPRVENNHYIHLCLMPSVTEFEGFVEYGGKSLAMNANHRVQMASGFLQPIFSTRKIQTEVSVVDGATVVMGGLTREEVKEVHDKTPFLGNLPLFGRLFRSKSETTQKRNLLIFVTANILSPQGGLMRDKRLNP